MSRHPEHDLIFFSNGEGLIEPLSGHPAQWLNLLSTQPKRVLLTPLPQHLWGYREHVLAQEGFKVIPANRSGLTELAERSTRGSRHERKQLRWRPRYPEALSQRPERWLIDEAPAPEDRRKLCFQLRLFLGTEGYQWLCSCAVYPLLLWDLTVYLGERLKYRQSFEENLTKLVQLPWFRYGTMPDWLRLQLVGDLEGDQEHEVRQALGDLLISSTDGVCDPIELEILTRRVSPHVRRKQGNKLLHDYVRAHPESLLHDYVLLTFMSGRKPGRLAVDVSPEVLDRLGPQDESKWLIYLLDVILLAVTYLILLITSLSGLIGLILGLVVASCNVIMVFQLNEWGVEEIAQAWRSARSPFIPKKTKRPDEKHPKGLYPTKKRQAGTIRDRISKLQNTSPTYTARLFPFAYFSLSAWILGLLQYAIFLANPFIYSDFFLEATLWLGLMENALWASAILSLHLKQFRKSLALTLLIMLSVIIALVAYQTTILTSLPFAAIEGVSAAAIFMALAFGIMQLRLSKISAAIFLIHGYSQWIWRSVWLSPSGTDLVFQLVFPAWRIVLLIALVKLILEIWQRVQSSNKDFPRDLKRSLLSSIKVMISSTVMDLGPEREAAERAIRSLNLTRFGAETFRNAPHAPKAICALLAEQCDIFLLIIGERYGYVVESEEISVVEFEYKVARAQNPAKILVYVKEGVNREPRLGEFLNRLQDFEHGHFTSWFTSAEDLQKKIQRDIVNWIAATTGENQLKSD